MYVANVDPDPSFASEELPQFVEVTQSSQSGMALA